MHWERSNRKSPKRIKKNKETGRFYRKNRTPQLLTYPDLPPREDRNRMQLLAGR
jgi:hypothetical protein